MPIFRLEGNDISKAKLIIAQETDLELESHLEDWLENSPRALTQEPLLWIGRQTSASVEDGTIFPDLLGVDVEGNLIIVELKRDEAPREVVAQLLEYAAWANELSEGQIQQIAKEYFETREELAEKDFHDAFRDMFDVSEIDELPSLNQKLRLFIVAEEIPASVVRVCRFLRTSHGLDLSCISISTFQTESGEEKLVSMEIKVGAEGIITPKTKRQRHSHSTQWSEDKPVKEVLWEAVQELTGENINVEFTLEEVREIISKKYPNFKPATLRGVMNANRVNDPAPNNHFVVNPDGKYWWIKRGTYRLYNPESDGIETDEEINLSESTVEHST